MSIADKYAHRGYHKKPEIPENSLAAFRRAIEYGLGSEFDVHLIADGSLVVFHDEKLERQTGAKGEIEDYDLSNLRRLRLEGTDEVIPTFDEVLGLYEDTGLPLLIELKVSRGNYKALTDAVAKRLDSYKGPFAVESFDPRAVMRLRKIRPHFTRGQLSQNFFKDSEGLPFYQVVLLTNMLLNAFSKPDFVSYRFSDRAGRTDRGLMRRGGKCKDNGADDNSISRSAGERKDSGTTEHDPMISTDRGTETENRKEKNNAKAEKKREKGKKKKKKMTEMSWTIGSVRELKDALKAGNIPIFENITPEELKEVFGITKRA